MLKPKDRHISFQAGKLGHKPWDPKASFSVQINFNSAVFVKPLHITANYDIKPGLFKDWQWDESSKSYTFTIDNQFKFSEDRTITPKDIEFAFIKSFLSDFGEYKRNYFFDIVGVEKLNVGQPFKSGMCDGVRVLGEDKIVITLKKTNPNFIYVLQDAIPVIAPIEDFSTQDYFRFKGVPRGPGDYFVAYNDPNSSKVVLELKDGNKYIESHRFTPLKITFLNEGDPIENLPTLSVDAGSAGLKDRAGYTVQYGTIPYGISVIGFNYNNPLGSNKLFREAISLAIDRTKIFSAYPDTTITHELIPSMYLGRSGSKFEYNPKKSKDIVKKHFANLGQLKAIYHGQEKDPKKPYILEMERQLAEVGINIDFLGREIVRFNGDTSIVLRALDRGATYTDPISSFSPYIDSGKNEKSEYTDVKDQIAKNLFDKAKKIFNRTEKAKILNQLTEHFQKEYRVLPIGEFRNTFAFSSKIKSIQLNEISSSINFSKVQLAAEEKSQ